MTLFTSYQPKFFPNEVVGTIDEVSETAHIRVKCQATYWSAQLYQIDSSAQIEVGQTVRVIGRIGNTLLIHL